MRFLVAALLFLALPARATYLSLGPPVLQTVTQVSLNVLPSNNKRVTIDIVNGGPSTAFVQFSTVSQFTGTVSQVIAYQGFPVISGATLHLSPAPFNPVWADSPGSAALTIMQGQ